MATIYSTAHLEVPAGKVEARPVTVDSWFTPKGAASKVGRLKRKGLPDLTDWRFTTLTIADRTRSPEEAYHVGNERVRRFLGRLRGLVGHVFKWMWKLEIHEDGYPHWHLLWEHTTRLPEHILKEIEEAWGLGRCDTKRVSGEDFDYMWKYATKSVECCPEWIRNSKRMIRVVQSSKGFYTGEKRERLSGLSKKFGPKVNATRQFDMDTCGRVLVSDLVDPSEIEVGIKRVIRSLAEREEIAARKAMVVRYCEHTGRVYEHRTVYLPVTYMEFHHERHMRMLDERVKWLTIGGFLLTEWEASKYSTRENQGEARPAGRGPAGAAPAVALPCYIDVTTDNEHNVPEKTCLSQREQ